MKTLLDSNAIIYYFSGLTDDERIHELIATSFNISIMTKIEFLGWSKFADDNLLHEQAKAFISNAVVFDLTDQVAHKTIELRQQFKTKTPDAIIAATALVHNLTVTTNNSSDFERLGVEVIPVKLK